MKKEEFRVGDKVDINVPCFPHETSGVVENISDDYFTPVKVRTNNNHIMSFTKSGNYSVGKKVGLKLSTETRLDRMDERLDSIEKELKISSTSTPHLYLDDLNYGRNSLYNKYVNTIRKDKDNKVVFTNSFGEEFTEEYIRNNKVYWVCKSDLDVCLNCGFSIGWCEEDEFCSEIFKSEITAKKWIEQFKAEQLKEGFIFDENKKEFRELELREVCYLAKSVQDLYDITKSVPSKLISDKFDMDISKRSVVMVSDNTILNCDFDRWILQVSKDTFIKIANRQSND